jgi:hypothetical protein
MRRDVPPLSSLRDNGDRPLVIARENTDDRFATFRLKANAVPDRELKHALVGSGLLEEPQTLDDPMVQIDKFCFSKTVDINGQCRFLSQILLLPNAPLDWPEAAARSDAPKGPRRSGR